VQHDSFNLDKEVFCDSLLNLADTTQRPPFQNNPNALLVSITTRAFLCPQPFPPSTISLIFLEPISKLFEEHGDAGELDEPEEIGGIVLPADEEPSFPLQPGKEALDKPAAFVAT
jgi:hypothetical protein